MQETLSHNFWPRLPPAAYIMPSRSACIPSSPHLSLSLSLSVSVSVSVSLADQCPCRHINLGQVESKTLAPTSSVLSLTPPLASPPPPSPLATLFYLCCCCCWPQLPRVRQKSNWPRLASSAQWRLSTATKCQPTLASNSKNNYNNNSNNWSIICCCCCCCRRRSLLS